MSYFVVLLYYTSSYSLQHHGVEIIRTIVGMIRNMPHSLVYIVIVYSFHLSKRNDGIILDFYIQNAQYDFLVICVMYRDSFGGEKGGELDN